MYVSFIIYVNFFVYFVELIIISWNVRFYESDRLVEICVMDYFIIFLK